jgi:hypothetical protein
LLFHFCNILFRESIQRLQKDGVETLMEILEKRLKATTELGVIMLRIKQVVDERVISVIQAVEGQQTDKLWLC